MMQGKAIGLKKKEKEKEMWLKATMFVEVVCKVSQCIYWYILHVLIW